MRILHVLDHSLPLQSGSVSRTLGIVNEQRARKWDPVLMTTPRQNRGEVGVEEISGWRFHRTPAPNDVLSRAPVVNYVREMQATARRVSALIDEVRPDIVHAHSPALNGLPALWAAHPKGIPVVYEVRALWEEAGVEAGTVLKEFRVEADQLASLKPGDVVSVSIFAVGQKVDVTGTSIGKGFSGPIKRHNFSSNRASHGNSISHNSPGSIGMAQDPGRVFPGKRMSGHLGDVASTQQSLEIVRVDEARGLLLVKGAVPGAKGGDVVVRPAVKAKAAG